MLYNLIDTWTHCSCGIRLYLPLARRAIQSLDLECVFFFTIFYSVLFTLLFFEALFPLSFFSVRKLNSRERKKERETETKIQRESASVFFLSVRVRNWLGENSRPNLYVILKNTHCWLRIARNFVGIPAI